jgi:hypothetical protein
MKDVSSRHLDRSNAQHRAMETAQETAQVKAEPENGS